MIAALGLAIALSNDLVLEGTDIQLYDRGYVVTGPKFTRAVIDGEVKEYDRGMSGGVLHFPETHVVSGSVLQEPYSGKVFQIGSFRKLVNRQFATEFISAFSKDNPVQPILKITNFASSQKYDVTLPTKCESLTVASDPDAPFLLIVTYEAKDSYHLWKVSDQGEIREVMTNLTGVVPILTGANSRGYTFGSVISAEKDYRPFGISTGFVFEGGKPLVLDPLQRATVLDVKLENTFGYQVMQRFDDGRILFEKFGKEPNSIRDRFFLYDNGQYSPLMNSLSPTSKNLVLQVLDSHPDGRIAYKWIHAHTGAQPQIHITNIMKKP
ncbi:MAG: hypothetical protein KDC26_11040 [Armatimonadetes bacterium]|nr:hypothetical protein [Armatimonadota bacterium]